jgi:hypothetical protein
MARPSSITVAAVATSLFVLLCAAQTERTLAYEDSSAYEVYAAILGRPCEVTASGGMDWENLGCDVRRANPLLIRRETVKVDRCTAAAVSDKSIAAAFDDWVSRNKTTWLLKHKLSIPIPHDFIAAEELKSTFEQGPDFCKESSSSPNKIACSWETFTNAHPNSGGWIEVSAVGFNPKKTIAVVYVGHSCGSRCGRGFVQALKKKDGVWTPVKWAIKGCGWIS